MRIRLTERGLLLLSIMLSLVVVSTAVSDVIMLGIAMVIGVAIFSDLIYTSVGVVRSRCYCVGCGKRYRLWVWEEKELVLHILCRKHVSAVHLPKWAQVQEAQYGSGEVRIRIKTAFDYYGSYRLSVTVEKPSFLWLYTVLEDVDTGIELVVYPEALYWVLRVLGVLGLYIKGFAEPSMQQLLPTSTDFGEYTGSREYVSGVPLRRVDWRATAKFSRLYIKLFSVGGEASQVLAFDRRCIGRYTCDRIASALLTTAMALARSGSQTSLCYVDEWRCNVFDRGEELLLHTLNAVFQLNVVDYGQLYEFVEPPIVNVLQKLLKVRSSEGFEVMGDAIYIISDLFHDTEKIFDIGRRAVQKGIRCSVLTSARPWIDASSSSEESAIKKSHRNVVRALKSVGVDVIEMDVRRARGATW